MTHETSFPIRVLAWGLAAWCAGFAAVNVVQLGTGRFATGPYADLAAGLTVMSVMVIGLKLLGAVVAVRAVAARRPTAVLTVLVWGAFALLGLYSAGNIVELVGFVVADPAKITPWSLAYVGFFLVGAIGYGVLTWSYVRRTGAGRRHAVLGVIGAPLVLGGLLVATPAVLAAAGLFPGV